MHKPFERKIVNYLIPTSIYLLVWGVFEYWDFNMIIHWGLFQLLDYHCLLNHPINSLLLLHSQPPLLNALLAIILKISQLISVQPAVIAKTVFIILGLISTYLLFHVLMHITHSLKIAAIGITAELINPGYHFFQNSYFYPYLLHFFFVVLIFWCFKYFKNDDDSPLVMIAFLLSLICNTRALFHPFWAIILFSLIVFIKRYQHDKISPVKTSPIWIAVVVFGLLLVPWQLKNYVLFGRFTFSTWTGFNLTRHLPVNKVLLRNYISSGLVPEAIQEELMIFQQRYGFENISVIRDIEKPYSHARNWNHYIFAKMDQTLQWQGFLWRKNHFVEWMKVTLRQYFFWSRATYFHPYEDAIFGSRHKQYRRYARIHHGIFYYNLEPIIDKLLPEFLRHKNAQFNLFGVLFFPTIMACSIGGMICNLIGERKYHNSKNSMMVVIWFVILWILLVPCLTDGIEGNRMRFSISPLFIIVLAILLKTQYLKLVGYVKKINKMEPS